MVQVRAIFISDLHLGTRNCQAEKLLELLRHYESDYLYLLGDVVDLWAMSRSIHWSPAQNTVIQKILKRARHGVRVVLVPGNHDEALREHEGVSFGNIRVVRHGVHHALDGRRYLLIHGDEFDQVARYHRWLTLVGDHGYSLMMALNHLLSQLRRALGMVGHWSLSAAIKRNLKHAVAYVRDYETAVASYAAEQGFDGVICGHIHVGTQKDIEGVRYINCGDWVESCSAVIEHLDGRMELLGAGAVAATHDAQSAPAHDKQGGARGGNNAAWQLRVK